MKKNYKFHLRIESELLLNLKKQAEEQEISVSELIRQKLRECPRLNRIEMIVEDITTGKYIEIKGVVPGVRLVAYIHNLKIRIDKKEFEAPVALADSDDVPMILGRVKSLDLFDANFVKGKMLRLKD